MGDFIWHWLGKVCKDHQIKFMLYCKHGFLSIKYTQNRQFKIPPITFLSKSPNIRLANNIGCVTKSLTNTST